jgi:SAM-dependent methyltransferase
MTTFRRRILDSALERSLPLMQGRVLDVGGRRSNQRGRFRPPLDRVEQWQYLNPDPSTDPDFCCSAESIPLPAGSCDTVVMTEVLQYVPEPQTALGEINRVLRDGGVLLASVPLLVSVHGDYWADRSRMTSLGLNEMLANAGFGPVEIEPMGSLGTVLNDILYVTLGYANEGRNKTVFRPLRGMLYLLRPLFEAMDSLGEGQKKYITSGYFIKAWKSKGIRRQ